MLLIGGCGGNDVMRMPPTGPSQSPTPVTASAYILPDAVSLGDWAFGDEPIVIYKSERLRWVNADTLTHVIVADSPDATDFRKAVNAVFRRFRQLAGCFGFSRRNDTRNVTRREHHASSSPQISAHRLQVES
jgi:hypothetical protein